MSEDPVVCEDCGKVNCEIRGVNHPMPCSDFVKKSCSTCGQVESCNRPIRSMASDEELKHVFCLYWVEGL